MFELNPSTITFVIGIIGTIFGVYHYFKNPQIDLDKQQALNEEKDKGKATVLSQQEAQGKASLLAQQVQWEKESTDKKFIEMGVRIEGAFTMAQNHIHTVDTKVDGLSRQVNDLKIEITKLSTIIEERMPKK